MSSSHNHGTRYSSTPKPAGDIDARVTALEARVTALEKPTPIPVPPQPPATGIPAIPAGTGTILRHDFAKDGMGPFRTLVYPDAHPGDNMEKYNRFANGAHNTTIHDGFLDLRATKRADGLWDAAMVGTSQDGNGPTYGYGRFSFCTRANVGRGTWQSCWLYDTTTWTSTEIDWPEMLENQQLSAHVLGAGAGKWYGAPPADWATAWHVFTIVRDPSGVTFSVDGGVKAHIAGAMPATKLAILLDSKLGHPWSVGPDASTPDPTWLQVAWVTVD